MIGKEKTPKKKEKKKKKFRLFRKWYVLLFLFAVAVVVVMAAVTAWRIFFFAADPWRHKADAAIVLGAGVEGEKPGAVFAERINHAVKLYEKEQVKKIIFTGGHGMETRLAEAEAAKRYAIEAGVDEDDILIETRSATTYENLKNALDLSGSHRCRTFLIVSDPLHMKRAMMMAGDLAMDAYPSPTPTTKITRIDNVLGFLIRETYYSLGYLVVRRFK